jgi:HPt (histidine-containing phosphotransfer) domain-containing protein
VRDAEKALVCLNDVYSNGYSTTDDVRLFVINAHAMKSALMNIGETGLSAAAFKLEQAGRMEDKKIMMVDTPAFLEGLGKVIEKYKLIEDDSNAVLEDSESDRAYLSEKLLTIQKACEEYDEKNANKALSELGQKKWARATRELLDAITECLLCSDFEDAAKLARDYPKK